MVILCGTVANVARQVRGNVAGRIRGVGEEAFLRPAWVLAVVSEKVSAPFPFSRAQIPWNPRR
jgi:CMP-2-keto-3-deoxyoctulosonic acid synthetase